MNRWLGMTAAAVVADRPLRPRPHPLMPRVPLSVVRGQAEAFHLIDTDESESWVVKKFHVGMAPDRTYLDAIADRVPAGSAFRAGKERRVVSKQDVRVRVNGLAAWFDGTVLMPTIAGRDWATVADDIRDGGDATNERRLRWAVGLAEAVAALEDARAAHRDLSSGNVFIDTATDDVALIDWDSLYHPDLAMPGNTTIGTQGYLAPFVARDQRPERTWRAQADRFALAVCIVEMLTVDVMSPVTGDGGLFDQGDLNRASGPSIDRATAALDTGAKPVADLFGFALRASDYDRCPSPADWVAALGMCGVGRGTIMPVRSVGLTPPEMPALELPQRGPEQAPSPPTAPPLPPDPWRRRP